MRPIHALLVLALLAAGLLIALFSWTGRGSAPSGLDAAQHAQAPAPEAPTPADLAEAPQARGPEREAGPLSPAQADARPGAKPAPARGVTGRVVDPDGKAVAGASVYAAAGGGFDELALDEVDPSDVFGRQRVDAKTDAQGRFALQPKADTQLRLAVRAAGFAPLDLERTLSAASGDVGDLVVQPGVVLEGRVIDHLGRPVAGAELRRKRTNASPFVLFAGRGGAVVARTDDAGAFRADQMAPGPWTLRVTSEAAPDKEESGETSRPGEVVRGLTIQLEEGFEIAGRVTGVPPGGLKDLRVVAMPRGAADFGGEFAGIAGGQRSAAVRPDGAFTVRGCRKDGRYRLSARQGQGSAFRMQQRSAGVDASAGDRGVELVWREDTALVFQVVDGATGAPVTNLSVSAGARWTMPLMDEKNRPVRDFPEGRVRYGGLRLGPGGSKVTLRVEAPGFAPYEQRELQVTEGQDNDLGVIRLQHTTVVRVRVTERASGKPVAAARVELEEVVEPSGPGDRSFSVSIGGGGGDDDEPFASNGAAHRARTDAEGRATVSSFPGSRGRLIVRHADFSEWRSEPFALPASQDLEREVVLSVGGTVVVTVVDPQGRAVPAEPVEHRAPDGEDATVLLGPGGGQATDAEGRVIFEHLPPGRHGFRLRSGGGGLSFGGGGIRFGRARIVGQDEGAADEAPWTEAEVADGARAEVKLVARERARLAGRVREGGRPLAGASLTLRAKDSDALPFFDSGPKADSGGDGNYAFDNVPVGEYVLSVEHAGRAMGYEVEARVRAGDNRLDVDLPLSVIEGRVTGEDGKPLVGVRVRAERQSGGESRTMVVFAIDAGDGPVTFGGGPATPVVTDQDGRYRLRGVLADADLKVVATGQGVQRGETEPLRVGVDQTRTGVDLVLRQGATLDVQCRRFDGSAATPCEVRAELQGDEQPDTKVEITNGEGRVRFAGLQPGRWRLTARNLGLGPEDGAPPPVEQTVDLVVGRPQQVTLEVRSP